MDKYEKMLVYLIKDVLRKKILFKNEKDLFEKLMKFIKGREYTEDEAEDLLWDWFEDIRFDPIFEKIRYGVYNIVKQYEKDKGVILPELDWHYKVEKLFGKAYSNLIDLSPRYAGVNMLEVAREVIKTYNAYPYDFEDLDILKRKLRESLWKLQLGVKEDEERVCSKPFTYKGVYVYVRRKNGTCSWYAEIEKDGETFTIGDLEGGEISRSEIERIIDKALELSYDEFKRSRFSKWLID